MMRAILRMGLLLVTLYIWVACTPLIAQSSEVDLIFERFDLPDSKNAVLKMYQDSPGFLWFASKIGLIRYDGLRFLTFPYDAVNEQSLTNDDPEFIYQDKQGILWLTHVGGFLTSFDPITEEATRYTLPDSLRTIGVNLWSHCVVEDHEGSLWVGTNQGLFRLDQDRKKIERFLHDENNLNSLSHNDIKELYLDSEGTLWIGTGFPWAEDKYPTTNLQSDFSGGLHRYRPETEDFERFVHDPNHASSLRDERIGAIFEDSRKDFWVGTWGDGLHKMDRNTGIFQHFPYDPKKPEQLSIAFQKNIPIEVQTNNHVTFIGEDLKKRIWIGTWGGGLNVHDPITEKTKHFENKPDNTNSLPVNSIWDFYVTRDGVIWFCSGGKNWIFKANEEGNQFPFIDLRPFLNNETFDFTCIIEDREGNVWLGTKGSGLIHFNPKSKALIDHYRYDSNSSYSLSANSVTGIHEDHQDGTIWVSTSRGLNHLDPKTGNFKRYQFNPYNQGSLAYYSGLRDVRPIFQDHRGDIWVVTGHNPKGGLNRVNRETDHFQNFAFDSKNPESIGENTVWAIHEDKDSNLWVGGSRFLDRYQYKTGVFEHFDLPLGVKGVREIVSDRNGKIWFRSMSNELAQLNPKSGLIRLFNKSNGLIPTDKIFALYEGNDHRIWIRSENALLVLDPHSEEFQSYPSPPDLSPDLFYYGFLAERQLYGANFVNPGGTHLYPERGGYYAFDPDDIQVDENISPPTIIISELIVGDQRIVPGKASLLKEPIWATKSLRLAHHQNSFSLAIACLDFRNPRANQLEFRLDDYDQEWRTDHQDGLAIYKQLAPGKYLFRARGASGNGSWNQEGVLLQINIAPPWWQTIWAMALFIGLILGGMLVTFRFQLNRKMAKAETQRLRELDQVKTRLYTNITHEFRTPLTIIAGMTEQVKENPKRRLQESLNLIKRNSDKLLNLVNQMLDLRKLESGTMPVNWQQADIINFLKYILDSFSVYAEGKKVQLHFLAEQESFIMDFDPDKIQQIISNLLSNALKFTKEGGNVYISVRKQSSPPNNNQNTPSEALEIQVKDTGIGISESQLPHIFDRFYQANDHLVGQAEGTGIGLALTRELVKLLHGEVMVQSRVGEGTTFTLILPVFRKASPAEIQSLISEQTSGLIADQTTLVSKEKSGIHSEDDTPLILIVEDNRDVVYYLRSCLQKYYRLEVAENGQEGIDKALEIIPDLIISDIMMPEVDGYTLCDTLKKDERSNHIPIVLLTAKADHASKIKGLQKGADAYLAKPFNQEELLVRLQQLLELRRKLQLKYKSENFAIETATQKEDEFVIRVRQLIMDHLDDDSYSIPLLSRDLQINRVHLHRKIKALTGKTAAHFIRQIRLQEGRRLLLNTDLHISEIAYNIGFKDPAYFTRVFTELYGESPSAMRNNHS